MAKFDQTLELDVKFSYPEKFLQIQLAEGGMAPVRSSEGAGGYDCFARSDTVIPDVEHGPWSKLPIMVRLGFSVAIPEGWVGLLRARSGLASRYGAVILGGVIDSDYRGEVVAMMKSGRELMIKAGDRVAQLVIVPCLQAEVEIVDELNKTVRGDGGFGSTGV